MNVFDLTKVMFENPGEYSNVNPGEKRKHFFMLNRRFAINFPLQAHALQHVGVDEVGVVDFWQRFLRKQYNKTPFWMFVKGTKKSQEEKEKKLNIKEATIKQFASTYGYDLKSVKEAIDVFPDQMKKELSQFQKMVES